MRTLQSLSFFELRTLVNATLTAFKENEDAETALSQIAFAYKFWGQDIGDWVEVEE